MGKLTILYKRGLYSFEVDGTYEQGMVASFTGNRRVSACRPDQTPIGFFVSKPPYFPSFKECSALVAVGQGEYAAGLFEDVEYSINDLLYCSPKGLITTKKALNRQPTVGIVSSVGGETIGFITFFSAMESVGK